MWTLVVLQELHVCCMLKRKYFDVRLDTVGCQLAFMGESVEQWWGDVKQWWGDVRQCWVGLSAVVGGSVSSGGQVGQQWWAGQAVMVYWYSQS